MMIFPFLRWDVVQSVGVILDMMHSSDRQTPTDSEQKTSESGDWKPPNESKWVFPTFRRASSPRWMVWLVQMTLQFPNVVGWTYEVNNLPCSFFSGCSTFLPRQKRFSGKWGGDLWYEFPGTFRGGHFPLLWLCPRISKHVLRRYDWTTKTYQANTKPQEVFGRLGMKG